MINLKSKEEILDNEAYTVTMIIYTVISSMASFFFKKRDVFELSKVAKDQKIGFLSNDGCTAYVGFARNVAELLLSTHFPSVRS